jgi:hypothetical protein
MHGMHGKYTLNRLPERGDRPVSYQAFKVLWIDWLYDGQALTFLQVLAHKALN